MRALAAADPTEPDESARCRFPLRARWLIERLGLEAKTAPCPKHDVWRRDLHADAVTLVFASAYLNNPSSMYGHTFLRVDQKGHGSQEKLLDHAVNFAATVDTDNGLLFAVYGLVGKFPGRFSAMPYYLKVQEYSNLESRDLWEYPLKLSSSTLDRLAEHVWELGAAEFPYYFFNKNCSYQLFPLLEAADPRMHLTDRWPLYVVPVDTVRTLVAQPGFVGEAVFRPSRVTTMLAARARLSRREAALAGRLARADDAAWSDLESLDKERQALVLSSAADYLGFSSDFRPEREAAQAQTQRKVLVALGKTGVQVQPPRIAAPTAPDKGHHTARAGAGYGFGDRRFAEVGLRLALHDMLDPRAGYANDSALEMLQFRLRHDIEGDRNYLHSFDLVRILSLSPYDPWVSHPSWKVDTGWRSAPELDARPWRTGHYGLTVGTGKAAAARAGGREVAFAMGEVDAGAGGILRRGYRVGGGGTAALQYELAPRLNARAEAGYLAYALGDPRPVARFCVEASLALARDVALRARLEKKRDYREAFFSLHGYF